MGEKFVGTTNGEENGIDKRALKAEERMKKDSAVRCKLEEELNLLVLDTEAAIKEHGFGSKEVQSLNQKRYKVEEKIHKQRIREEKFATAQTALKEKNRSKQAWKSLEKDEKKKKVKNYIKRYWQLYLMILIPVIYLLVFKYVPMVNVVVAFKDFKYNMSVFKMPWAKSKIAPGVYATDIWKWFRRAFSTADFKYALRNNVGLHMLDMFFGFPAPIIFALVLNELPFKHYKKAVQTIAYMPHFLSWVIIYSLSLQLFADDGGLVNVLIRNMGGNTIPFLSNEKNWVVTYVALGVWQSFGWGSIIYLASIAGINPELYEAAAVDGAGRFRKMFHITLPGIKSTIVVLLIMNVGGIMGGNFDRPFAMQNAKVLHVAETIGTFVYKNGIRENNIELSTAVGLFQSVVGLIFLLGADKLSRKLGERGIW